MRVGIITFHRAINFGAILQVYALQTSIEKFGVDCEVIDYRSSFIEKHYQPISIKSLPSFRQVAVIILKNGAVKNNRLNFENFSNKYLNISSVIYEKKEQLEGSNDYYDLFITGSDQVWNYLTAGFDKSYFLDFVQDKSKKNSYAASFGVDSIPETYKKDYYKLLSDFQNISVREQQGADIVKDVLEVNPPVLLDPTLMLNREEWNRVSSKNKENAEYLLLYLIAESKSIISLAKRVAKERNLKIIYISDRLYKSTGMDNRSKVGVDEWVNLFLNASFIVTNSFHGVAFSINFQKEFYMQYLPGNAKVNSRLENILELTGLKDRFVSDFEKINIDHIDYSKVNKILQQEREKSIKYLKNVLNKD